MRLLRFLSFPLFSALSLALLAGCGAQDSPLTPPVTDIDTVSSTVSTPDTVPDTTPDTVPDTTPGTIPDTTPGTIPDTTSVTIPDTTSVTIPDTTSVTIPDTTSVTIPDTTSVTIPDTTSVTIPDTIPDIAPDTTLDSKPTTTDSVKSEVVGKTDPPDRDTSRPEDTIRVPVLPIVGDVQGHPQDSAGQPGRSIPTPDAALAARMGVPEAAIYLNTDLEDEDPACWDNRVNGYNRAGCGKFKGIGSFPMALSTAGIAHSGTKAIRITYVANEEVGGTNVGVNADSINVRAYYYFDQGFDFGQGMKIGRVQSFNASTQTNDVDVILQCRSVNGANQCGVTEMNQLGLHYNGRPVGSDWGALTANVSFQRGRWYAVEYQVILNTPGMSDGIGRLWVDGRMVGERKDLRIRGNFGTGVKLNTVRVGGWYSNSAGGNPCANPSQPSRIYMDDVVIAKGYIGPEPAAGGI